MLLNEISENVQTGNSAAVIRLVTQAMEAGIRKQDIMEKGFLGGMKLVIEQFDSNEVLVPEVLVAVCAMNKGMKLLPGLQRRKHFCQPV